MNLPREEEQVKSPADVVKVGDHMPELDIAVDAGGKPFKLKALKGKWLIVTVGADWCVPCHKELPAWDKIAPDYESVLRGCAPASVVPQTAQRRVS